MSTLEGLHLVVGYPAHRRYRLPNDIKLTGQRFPRLRRIALTGLVEPQETSFYTQLRILSLTTCSYNLFDRFLDTLAGLQILHLDNTVDCLPGGDWMQRDPDLVGLASRRPLILFPHLTKFVTSGHGSVCTARFLAHFHIQASVCLAISAYAEDSDQDRPVDIPSPGLHHEGARSIAVMLPSCHAATLEPLDAARAIHISMYFASSVKIGTPAGASPQGDSGGVVLSMRLAPHWNLPSRWGSVANLSRLLGRSPLTFLLVTYVLPDAVEAQAGAFQAFPLLERLYIEGDSSVGMENAFLGLHAASADSTGADPDCLGPVACLNLAHVGVLGHGNAAVYEAIWTCV